MMWKRLLEAVVVVVVLLRLDRSMRSSDQSE